MNFAAYAIGAKLHRGRRSTIVRATRLDSGERVVLKESSGRSSPSAARTRSRHEFRVAAPIRSDHVARYLGLEEDEGRVVVVEEPSGDRSLAEILAAGRLPLDVALSVGAQIAAGLVEIHAHDVTHRAIHPGNVVVDTGTWVAKIVDFAEASVLDENPEPARSLDDLAMPLAYVSPEQTGRMNRQVDYRTDLYSLGATLYHAIAGRPVFEIADRSALVHAQIALRHRPLAEVDSKVPLQVSRIVDKLLAKNAEDRYQSARGVAADLEECVHRLRVRGTIDEFSLGRDDVPEKFRIPDKLYGRGAERAALLEAFDAAAAGDKRLLLVAGYSGIGKSSLVHEIHKPIVARRGIFVSGKFEPLHRHAPYSALRAALGQLCRNLMTLPDPELAEWKGRILDRLQDDAGLMTDFVPGLERVVGAQPPAPEAGLLEAARRFERTLARFLSVFAGADHPLALFLDDLQWADPATLRALGGLLRLPEPTHLLVLGAYRDNEVDSTHPLSLAIEELRGAGVNVKTLHLAGLADEDVTALVADALHRAPSEVRGLAARIADKTSGNPFFFNEFLRTLHDEKVLRFSSERRSWTWDASDVEAMQVTVNVADVTARKLERLPAATQDFLRLAAFLGNRFDLERLVRVSGLPAEAVRAQLNPAVRERLLVPLEANYPVEVVEAPAGTGADLVNYHYRFLHDLVLHAAYESVPEPERARLNLRVGKALWGGLRADALGDRVFDVVDHLNPASHLLVDARDRVDLAALNLEAGTRARSTTAYGAALEYLRAGIALLPEDVWSMHEALARDLHLGFTKSAYLAGHFEEARASSEALLPKLRTGIAKSEVYAVGIEVEGNRAQYARALELGREALAALGHPAPRPRALLPLLVAQARVALATSGGRDPTLATLQPLTDPRLAAVMRLLAQLAAPAYCADKRFFFWTVLETLRLALEHGVIRESGPALASYGTILVVKRRDYERAAAYGRLAMAMANQPDARAIRGRTLFIQAVCLNACAGGSPRSSVALLEEALAIGREVGDLFFVAHAASLVPWMMFVAGDPIDDAIRAIELKERAVRPLGDREAMFVLQVCEQGIRSLRGEERGTTGRATYDLDEEATMAEARTISAQAEAVYNSMMVIVRTYLGRTGDAARMVLAQDATIERELAGISATNEYDFFACLALTEALRDPGRDGRAVRRLLRKKRAVLEGRARSAPANFAHQEDLVSAEVAELEGRPREATELYHQAIQAAADGGLQHHAALASELAGRAFARRGQPQVARTYLEAARSGYARWGATGKVRAIDAQHPELAAPPGPPEPSEASLDVAGVVRASQAISSEIVLSTLLERMLRVIVQTAGAQRGALLVEHDGEPRVEIALDLPQDRLALGPEATSDKARFVSEAIVRYTLRTGEDVVLGHASASGPFTDDPYVVARRSKSILCTAVRHRDRVAGVLFLENDLATDAFTEGRLAVLRLLVAQAAISFENSLLFEKLKGEVTERTRAEATVRFLANAGAELSESLDDATVHEKIAHLVVPALADWCLVDVLDDDQRAHHVAAAHADPDKRRLMQPLQERPAPERTSDDPVASVVRSGEPLFAEEVDLDALRALVPDAEALRLTLALGVKSAMIVPMTAHGRTLGTLVCVFATGDRRYRPSERAALLELAHRAALAIDNARLFRKANEAVRVREEFLAVASHELYTPLTSLRLTVQSQLRQSAPGLPDRAKAAFEAIDRQTRRLSKLVECLLDVSQIAAGQLSIDLERVDLSALVREVAELFADEAARARSPLRLRTDDAVVGSWDRGRLDQVVSNLLANAIKFGAGKPIDVSVAREGGQALLVVEDRGIGIAAERLPFIFERFERGVSAHEYGGLGLGLYVVRSIVEKLAGTVRCESAPGAGARFVVALPC